QPPTAPVGPDLQQVWPREADEEEGRVAHPRGEVLDELEQRLLRPVDVLEDEDERLHLGELLRPRTRGPGELLAAALALDRGEDPGSEAQQVCDGLDLAARAELLERLLGV